MYLHLFGKQIEQSNLKKIKQNFYSPAEILNIYVRATGEEAGNKNTILSNLLMLSGDTFHFPSEKFKISADTTRRRIVG